MSMSAFFGRMNNRRYQRWSMEKTPRVSLYRKKICFAKDTLKRSERKPPKHVIAIGQGGKNNFVGRTSPLFWCLFFLFTDGCVLVLLTHLGNKSTGQNNRSIHLLLHCVECKVVFDLDGGGWGQFPARPRTGFWTPLKILVTCCSHHWFSKKNRKAGHFACRFVQVKHPAENRERKIQL